MSNKMIIYKSEHIKIKPFDELYFNYLMDFAKIISKRYKDINTLSMSFWCRSLNKKDFDNIINCKPRGTTFHICPANVPTMLFYSFVFSFITGNYNILRIPSKEFTEIHAIIETFKELQIPNTTIIKYQHDEQITEEISLQADTRMIWGGDKTIQEIKRIKSNPSCLDLCFSDKISYVAIDSDRYMEYNNKNELCNKLTYDLYLFGQKACSSPKVIFWFGNKYQEARQHLYKNISMIAQTKGLTALSSKIERELFIYEDAVNKKECYHYEDYNSTLSIIKDKKITEDHCGLGLLYDVYCKDVDELISYINKNKAQTLAEYGLTYNDKQSIISSATTLNRTVPIGETLKFGRYWDGFDLPMALVRFVSVR